MVIRLAVRALAILMTAVIVLGVVDVAWQLYLKALTFEFQMATVYWPPLQSIFKTTALTAAELIVCIVLSTIVFWAVETQNLFSRSQRETV